MPLFKFTPTLQTKARVCELMYKAATKVKPQAMCFEMKVNPNEVPIHQKHWVYDFNNRLQRKILPQQSIISVMSEIHKHAGYLKETKKSFLKTVKLDNQYEKIKTPV